MRLLFLSALFLFSLLIKGQSYNYYFGNLHAHTAFSDGNKDSVSSGVTKPDGSYAYAKLSNDFDFLGISEHNHYSSNRNPGFKRQLYQVGLNMAAAANQDGNFLALFGMEYGVSSQYNGHVLIYGYNQLIGWESSVPGVNGNNYEVFNSKTDYKGLFTKVKNNPNAFAYLAHPDFSDYTTDGTYATALSNAPYTAAYDSAIVGMPLRSGLATSAMTNYNDYSTGNYFNYYKKMLYQGYHLGIGYDHDNHYTNFGRSNGGRLVILAPALTQADFYYAMKHMHFYGSDDPNAKVKFHVNGNIMGSILTGSTYPTLEVLHNDPDGEQADTIKVWRGNKNSGGLWAVIVHVSNKSNTAAFIDNTISPGTEYYYFTELRQADGHWIVTSPVWYTLQTQVSLPEEAQAVFTFFPNPVSRQLNLSVSVCGENEVRVFDVSGREMLHETFYAVDKTLDLSALEKGIYSLMLSNTKGRWIKRLVVE